MHSLARQDSGSIAHIQLFSAKFCRKTAKKLYFCVLFLGKHTQNIKKQKDCHMKVKVKYMPRISDLSPAEIAAWCKHRDLSRQQSWNKYVIMTGLCPKVDAKEFYRLYDEAVPSPIGEWKELNFLPTHRDELLNALCQITEDDNGVRFVVWEDGRTGSHPPNDTTFDDRFIPFIFQHQEAGWTP